MNKVKLTSSSLKFLHFKTVFLTRKSDEQISKLKSFSNKVLFHLLFTQKQ